MEDTALIQLNTSELVARNAAVYAAETAFIFDGISYTWEQVDRITDHIAAEMLAKGVRKGMHIGFWSMNTLNLVLYLIAVMKIGAVAVVINYSYRTFELRNVLKRADVEIVFLGENKRGSDYRAMTETVRSECPLLRKVYDIDLDLNSYENELSNEWNVRLAEVKQQVKSDDVAAITFTSGTTKEPKPVMLTHYSIINDVNQFTKRMKVSVENKDVLMAPLPLFHCSGLSGMMFLAIVTGIPAIIHRSFVAQTALEDLERYHVTALLAVPTMLDLMIRHEDFSKFDISSLRVVQTSGSATSPEKLKKFTETLGLECLLIGYGQTECSPLITTVLYDDDMKTVTETVGVPLPHEKLRIWDIKEDRECKTGEIGEIQVMGFNTMKGYYHFEEEQKKKYTADGWLKTTDAGFLDERGYLHFSFRISENIIRHGENISPAEVEYVIESYSENILSVKVVGVPDPVVQEEVACVIQVKDQKRIDHQELRWYVKKQLASYKVPKYIFEIDEFPMTATGKIDQAAVKRMAEMWAAAENRAKR